MDFRLFYYDLSPNEKKYRKKCYFLYLIQRLLFSLFYPLFLKIVYRKRMKRSLDLKHPKTLTEKIQWLKLYERNALKEILSDKLAAKDYIKKNLSELKVAKVYEIADRFEDIDFDKLPNTFLLKTNHSCRTNILVSDKKNLTNDEYSKYSKFYKENLSINYAFWNMLELQYKCIKPKVYAEEFLLAGNDKYITEYMVWCFNGIPKIIEIISPKYAQTKPIFKRWVYDENWNKLEDFYSFIDSREVIPPPLNLDKILEYSKVLSKSFSFVRVDFMEAQGELYFGEMTFSPASGFDRLNLTEYYDFYLGEKLDLKNI